MREWLFDLEADDCREVGYQMSDVQSGWPVGMSQIKPDHFTDFLVVLLLAAETVRQDVSDDVYNSYEDDFPDDAGWQTY